jgi:hypothetical protein
MVEISKSGIPFLCSLSFLRQPSTIMPHLAHFTFCDDVSVVVRCGIYEIRRLDDASHLYGRHNH